MVVLEDLYFGSNSGHSMRLFSTTIQDIQHLPWESIPMLFDQPVTRVPSLQFLLSKVQSHVVDLLRSFLAQLVSQLNDFNIVKKIATQVVAFTRETNLPNIISWRLLNWYVSLVFCCLIFLLKNVQNEIIKSEKCLKLWL